MKLLKKSVSLLLALCMILSYVPGTVFAAAPDTSNDDFYKIVHLDAGRKYWSVANIKALLDEMSEMGYNQLQIYFSDNQGFRFALNDMKVSFSFGGTDYSHNLSEALGNGIYQTGNVPAVKCDASQAHFRPSLEADGANYLSETEMDTIIAYANGLGIDIVPAFNFPGHMGAILDSFPQYKYGASHTSVDLDRSKPSRAFALAVLQKYVNYFSSRGCKFFSICADEYGYDTGESVTSISNNSNLYTNFATFMDEAAQIINNANMTPRAFSDYFYTGNLNAGVTLSDAYKTYQVYMWSGSNLSAIQQNGHKVINTSETAYYALGSSWYSLTSTQNGVSSFSPSAFVDKNGNSGTITDPAGAMFCIWNDRGYHASEPAGGDAGATVLAEALPYARTFATKLPKEKSINLLVGQTADVTLVVNGYKTNDQLKELYNFGSVLDIASSVQSGSNSIGISTSPATALATGDTVAIGDGTYYLKWDGSSLTATKDTTEATVWTVEKHESAANYRFKPSADASQYLDMNTIGLGSHSWGSSNNAQFEISNNLLKQVWGGNYIGISDTGVISSSGSGDGVSAFTASASTATTTFTFKGVAAGTVNFTAPDGTQYTVIVAANEHTHNSNVAATCIKGASCSICGEEQSTAKDANNHAGTISEANCAAAGVCDACHQSVGSTNPSKHTGETYKVNEKPASSTEDGYTGDIYCSGCNTELSKGTTIPMVHVHTGGVADCSNKAICSSCGEPYGNVDLNNHVGNRMITGITATYTGDTVCVSCRNIVERGTAIANDPTAIYITVPANGTATHKANGELVANGTSGKTENELATYSVAVSTTTAPSSGTSISAWESGKNYAQGDLVTHNGTVFYRKYGGSDGTPDASSQWGAWGVVSEWTAKGYEGNTVVIYNGKYYKASGWANESAVPGTAAIWVELNVGSGDSGSGETVTTTTITFTGGATNGNDTVTIGGQKFIVTVTGGNDPIIPGVTCEHTWEQKFDANGHWNYCEKCGSSTTKESHSGGTATCKEQAVCSTCNQKYGELAQHSWSTEYNYDADGHWQTCTVEGCGVTSEKVEHAGGNATCKDQAVCSTCKQSYGDLDEDGHIGGEANCQQGAVCTLCSTEYTEKDTDNHVGPMVEVENSYVAPTDDTDGKEADKTCEACGTTVTGAVIPALNTNIVELTIATGGTYQITISGKDVTSSIVAGDNNTATAANVFTPGKADKEEVLPQPVTNFVNGGTYVFTDGNGNYLMGTGNTTTPLNATQWTITLDEASGKYRITSDAGDLVIVNTEQAGNKGNLYVRTNYNTGENLWEFDPATNTFRGYRVQTWESSGYYTISYDSENGWKGIAEGASPATIYLPGEPFEAGYPSSSTVTFTGVNEGVTYITVDGTRYKINVVDAALLNAKLATPTWQTNRKAQGFADKNGNAITFGDEITAASHVGLITEAGVALSDLIPPIATKIDESNTLSPAIFWRGMRHNGDQIQKNSVDYHLNGDIINYIKYNREDNKWYGSADRNNWLDLTGYTLDIYYLQETAVTKEVITRVVDWGPDYVNSLPWEAPTYVLLDFAVHYDGVGRTPTLNSYPNAGSGVTGKNDMTVAYHCTHTTDDKTAEITVDGKTTWQRRIDAIFAIETDEYDIYMITVTRTEDDPTKQFAGETSNLVEDYSYNGTEYIIWTDTEATYNQKLGQTTMDGKVLAGLELRKDDFNITSKSDKMLMTRTVGGDPVVDYIQIYENQGLLVTYYVRAKQTEDSLTVHYRLEGYNSDIHNYYIAVEKGTFFDPGFDNDPYSDTGLKNNTITEFYGNTHTVNSDLSKLFDVPAEYRTGLYKFNEHIDFILEDGTKVHQEDYTESMGKIKEVILYYGMDNIHYVPVDFGHHLTITKDFFDHHVDDNFTIDSIELPRTVSGYNYTYGIIKPNSPASGEHTYVPQKILSGAETPIPFNVKLIDADGNTHTETHYIVFFPASTVYYEDFFVWYNNWATGNCMPYDNGQSGKVNYETDHQEDVCHKGTKIYNYGHDDGINQEASAPSHNSEIVMSDTGSYVTFTFTGTGIEIYANCTTKTANAAVMLFNGEGTTSLRKLFVVDTRLTNGDTTHTGSQQALGAAYNVPIVAVTDLPYGTYTVRVGYVNSSAARTDGFRFDGFRVFQPMQESAVLGTDLTVGDVYTIHHEQSPSFFELRDAVLAHITIPENYNGDYADQIGAEIEHQVKASGKDVVAAILNSNAVNGGIDANIKADILDNSAKNEIYLYPGQALVFKVADVGSMQLGMKAINGATTVKYYVEGANGVPTETTRTINSTTNMFYTIAYGSGNNGSDLTGDVVVVTNTGSKAVSITMLKLVPIVEQQRPRMMMLSRRSFASALTSMGYEPEAPVLKNGIVEENGALYYYVNDVKTPAGLIDIDGELYYANSSGKIVTGRYWVTKNNGILASGYYDFAEDGKMIRLNGIVEENGALYYYVDDVKTPAGLIEIDGELYYANSSGKIVTGRYWVTKNNGIMASGYYEFDETGKMVRLNGIVEKDGTLYYYVNDVLTPAGLIEIDGELYYANSSGKIVTGRYWVSKNNGIVASGYYEFDETGKMVRLNGIVEKDGTLYYYVNDVLTPAGLIEIDGELYYANSSGKIITGRYWVTKNNGIMPSGYYEFDATGKMVR